jgi:hypothetical protein
MVVGSQESILQAKFARQLVCPRFLGDKGIGATFDNEWGIAKAVDLLSDDFATCAG